MEMERTDEKQNGSALMQMPEKITTDDDWGYVNDPFICLICLELVHKPVVNACGHMFCFLCVHHSMNYGSESYCPLCRRQYMHFPRICEQLHFFLLKALPEAYRRRCKEAQVDEVQANVKSPQFDDGLQFNLNSSIEDTSPSTLDNGYQSASVLFVSTTTEEDVSTVGSQKKSNGTQAGTSSSSSNVQMAEQRIQPEVKSVHCEIPNGVSSSSTGIATSGLSCSLCKDLLCRPVVLNCGHVFCEGCVANTDGVQDSVLKCPTCTSFHPGTFPSVFLELHHYLNNTFPSEYGRRQRDMDLTAPKINTFKKKFQPCNNLGDELKLTTQRIHPSVGCDGCGIYPMTGRRFKCQDCGERPGYDLCLSCYQTQTSLVGRFNQKHTREHRMVEEDSEGMDDSNVLEGDVTIIARIPTWVNISSL